MDAETLAALKASIQHWRENVEAETPKYAAVGSIHCALCRKFNRPTDSSGNGEGACFCRGCPVFDKTGYESCAYTPFDEAAEKLLQWRYGNADRGDWRAAAQAELDFLISLLPEGEKP